MTELLAEALTMISTLHDDMQDELAAVLLDGAREDQSSMTGDERDDGLREALDAVFARWRDRSLRPDRADALGRGG